MIVEIATNLRVEEASLRLQGLLRDSRGSTGCHPVLKGSVEGRKIDLMLTQQTGNSILRPALTGTLTTVDVGTRLIGEFGLSKSARLISKVWGAFISIWTLVSMFVALRSDVPEMWLLPAVGAVVVALGVLLLRFSRSYYRSDEKRIVEMICHTINGVVRSDGASVVPAHSR